MRQHLRYMSHIHKLGCLILINAFCLGDSTGKEKEEGGGGGEGDLNFIIKQTCSDVAGLLSGPHFCQKIKSKFFN